MKRKHKPRQQKYGCGWCTDTYTVEEIKELMESAGGVLGDSNMYVRWKCRKGHETVSVMPLDKFS